MQGYAKSILLLVQILGALSFLLLPIVPLHFLWVTLIVYFFTTCIGGTITYHRLFSHRAFRPRKWFKFLGLISGVWGLYGSPIAWASVHRSHHAHVDTPQDPHSPLYQPWWRVQWLSMMSIPQMRNVRDLLRDPMVVFFHRHYYQLHVFIILGLILIDPKALLYAYVWPAILTWNLASSVNWLGHVVGYRNFNTRDNSRNNPLLGIVVFGEGWHNNHHAHPRRYSFREKWWEIDPSEYVIRLIKY